MDIVDFLEATDSRSPSKGDSGQFSDWLPFFRLSIRGSALQFVEKRVIGIRGAQEYECVEIPVEPGCFSVECRGVRYGNDARVAAMRAIPEGMRVERGKELKRLPVDLGGIAVVDITILETSMDRSSEEYEEWIDEVLFGESGASPVFVDTWEPSSISIPSCESGFGDGTYPCFELLSDGRVVGLEVEFIPDGTGYAFGG